MPRTTSRCLCGRAGVARDFFPVRLDSLSQSTVWDRQTCQGKALGAALQHVLYAMSGAPRGFAKVSHSPLGARAKPELRCCPHHWHSTRQDPALGGGSPEPQLGKTSPPRSSAQPLCSLPVSPALPSHLPKVHGVSTLCVSLHPCTHHWAEPGLFCHAHEIQIAGFCLKLQCFPALVRSRLGYLKTTPLFH